jgi:predicted exporter
VISAPAGRALIAWAALAAAVVYDVAAFRVSGDITGFVPDDTDREELAISRALAGAEPGRAMILVVSGGDEPRAVEAAAALAARLRGDPDVAWVEAGLDPAAEEAVFATFFPARFGFLSDAPEQELPEALSDAGLARAAQALVRELAGPFGAAVRRTVGADPLLAFHRHLRRMRDAQIGGVTAADGAFVTRDGGRGVIFLGTRASPFDADAQARTLASIRAAFDEVAGAAGGLRLEMSGVNRLAVAAEQSARADITRIGTVSLIGVALLFLICFRSVRYVAVLFVPVGFGLAGGLAACLAVFGDLHGMTLAFGATLIGVSDDYTIHFLQHHILRPAPGGAGESLEEVRGGLVLGALTTIVGFVGMAWASTPAMRQIAVFSSAGIACSLMATAIVVPPLLAGAPPRPGALELARRAMSGLFERLRRRRRWLAAFPAVAVAVCALAIPRLRWVDDPAALVTFDRELAEEDERVRELVSMADPGRFAVAEGPDPETALRRNDDLARVLAAARDAGELRGFQSLHAVIWSEELQRRNLAQVWGAPALGARVSAAMEAHGFRSGVFAELERTLAAPPPPPVLITDLASGPLAPLVRGLYLPTPDRVLILTRLIDVTSPDRLRTRLRPSPRLKFDPGTSSGTEPRARSDQRIPSPNQNTTPGLRDDPSPGLRGDDESPGLRGEDGARGGGAPGLRYFDQREFLVRAHGGFRSRVLEVVLFSLFAVLGLAWLRYRRWRPALAAVVPAALAAVTSLALLSLAGVELNLLHVLGLMLVLSIGEDYGVFVVEAARKRTDTGVAMVGTALSCATTALSFGLLAMSANPALRALGQTAALGSALSFALTPVAFILLEERR